MRPTPSLAIASVGAVVLACALSGCGSHDDYPKDWPAVETSWLRSCPDIAGTYALGHGAPPVVRTALDVKPPWEHVIIEGRPGGDLRFTLTRTVVPAEEATPWSPPHNALEQAQADYRARAAAKAAQVVPAELTQVLARGGYSCSRGRLTLRGGYVLARDRSHGLVGHGEHLQATGQVDVWCGDGCKGIPTGLAVRSDWQRWDWLGASR